MDEFPRRLKKLMALKGVNQTQLAKKAGVSPASVCWYLKGTREPQLSTIMRLAIALDAPTYELLGFEGSNCEELDLAVRRVVEGSAMLSSSERKILLAAITGIY